MLPNNKRVSCEHQCKSFLMGRGHYHHLFSEGFFFLLYFIFGTFLESPRDKNKTHKKIIKKDGARVETGTGKKISFLYTMYTSFWGILVSYQSFHLPEVDIDIRLSLIHTRNWPAVFVCVPELSHLTISQFANNISEIGKIIFETARNLVI